MERKVAREETLVNPQDTAEIKQFPRPDVSSEETRGEPRRVDADTLKRLGAWALKKRKAEGLTQSQVSKVLDKSQVNKIEKAKISSITLDTLYNLATGLNTTIDEPLREMGYLPADSVSVRGELGRFLATFQELPEDWRAVVGDLASLLHRRLQKDAKRGSG